MLVDRHHTKYLIELGALASGKSAAQLEPERDRLEAFLGTLTAAATPQAVLSFEARMRDGSKDDALWTAVRVLNTGAPLAAALLLGAQDDDPDSEEDGNRLPARETPGWAALYQAFEQWNTPTILAWIGPLGWQAPSADLELVQDAELAQSSTTSPTIGAAASLAAEEADARSKQTLRVVGTAAAIGGASALLVGLGRALGR